MVQKKPTTSARNPIHPTKLSTAPTPLLTSAFSPPYLRLSLFASTILGLDAHRLRIHDTATGRLRCEYTFDKGTSANSLSWGSIPAPPNDHKGSKKKRKRVSTANGEDQATLNVIVAIATSKGSILLFSPREGAVVGSLEGGHLGEVRQFVFSGEAEEGKGWSCGVDGKLVEWDLRRRLTMRTINLPDPSIQRLAYTPPSVLCASHTVYAINYANPGMAPPPQFTANTAPIHSVLSSDNNTHFLSAADSDRFINVFSIPEKKSIGALVAESDVKSISVSGGDILVAVTTDGVVELFKKPYEPTATSDPSQSPTASRKRKSITRKGDAKVKIIRPDSISRVNIVDASIQDEDLIVAWVESGVNMEFEKIRWSNPGDGGLVLNGLVEITRSDTVRIGGGTVMNGVKDMGKASVDQSKSIVIGGVDTQDAGMEDVNEGSENEEEQVEEGEDEDEDEDDKVEREAEEPSFAEKFQALEVYPATKTATSTALTTTSTDPQKAIQPPSAGSLTTVLTQALKTNDTSLLESCFHTTDSNSILSTVRRLNSTMAVSLLERLAERIARRPGRAGSLGIWVRWTLVAHGGYLVSLPDLMSTLSGLYSTLNTRAGALPRLLALQGRLDMLHAQVDLRKALQSSVDEVEGDAGDKGVLYIEGQEQDSSDDGSDQELEKVGMQGLQIEDASFISGGVDESEDEDEDLVNDVEGSSAEEGREEEEGEEGEDEEEGEEGEDEGEGEDEEDGFFDIEASEASEGSEGSEEEDEDEVDYDDVDAQILDTDEEEEQKALSKSRSRSRR